MNDGGCDFDSADDKMGILPVNIGDIAGSTVKVIDLRINCIGLTCCYITFLFLWPKKLFNIILNQFSHLQMDVPVEPWAWKRENSCCKCLASSKCFNNISGRNDSGKVLRCHINFFCVYISSVMASLF